MRWSERVVVHCQDNKLAVLSLLCFERDIDAIIQDYFNNDTLLSRRSESVVLCSAM